jgi:hypothetical protein
MNLNMTFEERAKIGLEMLANRHPHTLNEMKAQALWVRGDFLTKEEALKFVNALSDEEYMDYITVNKPKGEVKKNKPL